MEGGHQMARGKQGTEKYMSNEAREGDPDGSGICFGYVLGCSTPYIGTYKPYFIPHGTSSPNSLFYSNSQ